MIPVLRVLPTPELIAAEAARLIVDAANVAIAEHGHLSIALSGGSTPKLLYKMLASPTLQPLIDWTRVEVFFVDERCVPPDHPDSNYRMAHDALLSTVPIPGDNIYRMRGELDPEAAAKEYGLMLQEKFGDGGLDVILLGMGDDGHTASLFPGTRAVNETKHRVVANFAEHSTIGKSWRITMTAPFINRSNEVAVLVSGSNKAATLRQVLEGPRDPQKYPIQLIEPESGRITWLIDADASGMRDA